MKPRLISLGIIVAFFQMSAFPQSNKEAERKLREEYEGKLVEVRLPQSAPVEPRVEVSKEIRTFLEGDLPTFARVQKLQLKKKAVEVEVRFILFYREASELREAASQRWSLRLKWDESQPSEGMVAQAVASILVPVAPNPAAWENYWPPEIDIPQPTNPPASRPSREIAPGIFTGGADMVPPQCISCPNPEFPPEARTSSGLVILMTVVTTEGRVRGVFVRQATPAGYGFEDAAVWAVSNWRFKPAVRAGKPVAMLTTIEIDFHRF